jgi:aryl-alcohol dehydrogenase
MKTIEVLHMRRIKAAVVHQANTPFVIEDVDLADPKESEVLIKVASCGVCHTDEGGREGVYITPFPAVFGHEGSGIIEQTGSNVTDFSAGDHVVMSYPACGHCDACYEGRPYQCKSHYTLSFGGKYEDGTNRIFQNGNPVSSFFGQSSFAEYAVVNTGNLVKVDPDLDLSYMGPLACGVLTGAGTVMNVLKPEIGSNLAVFGAGSVGLSALMAAKLYNCHPLIAVDVNDDRLKVAAEFGATHTINGKLSKNLITEIMELTDGRGLHNAVETTGIISVMRQMTKVLSTGGMGGLVARANTLTEPMMLGRRLVGIQTGEAVIKTFIPKLLRLNKLGLFPYDKMISFYDFKDINKAFEDAHNGTAIKAVLKIGI